MSSKSEALELIILAASSTTMRHSLFASCRKKNLLKAVKLLVKFLLHYLLCLSLSVDISYVNVTYF